MQMLISGLSMLKKQKGRYAMVGTLSIVAWVIPQLLHGKSGDVTVDESSTERPSSLLS